MSHVSYSQGGTACRVSNHSFAKYVAQNIAQHIGQYVGGTVCIRGYTPPYEADQFPEGFIEFCIQKTGLDDAPIGIEFGTTTEEGHILTCDFDYESWLNSGRSPIAGRIVAANFDEAWRIVCLTSQLLQIHGCVISYGA